MAKGWFELSRCGDGQFCFSLKAPNGEAILTSELYLSRQEAEKGIASVWGHCSNDAHYVRRTVESRKFFFNLRANNHQVIGTSQMYATAKACEDGIASVRAHGGTGLVKDNT